MNGSRSTHPLHGDRSSLDALNRTIEGLEARLEGLMQTRDKPRQSSGDKGHPARAPQLPQTTAHRDPLQEIRERQRSLAGTRIPESDRRPAPERTSPSFRPPLEPRRPAPRAGVAEAGATPRSTPMPQSDGHSMHEVVEAMAALRKEIRQDVAQEIAREIGGLRSEIGGLRTTSGRPHIDDDVRADLARLADGIDALGHRGGPAADALRDEYEQLLAAVEGLAREETIQRLDSRWDGLEERLLDLDTHALREELVGLAYRIDDIKGQLGTMSDSPAIRALEQKLVAVATAMEQLGSRMQPNDEALNEQFAILDERLDEISRAIAASGRAASAPAMDHALLERLENRLGSLAQQIDAMAVGARPDATRLLSERIEGLSERVEQLAGDQVLRLEERLDQLSQMLTQTSRGQDADLADFLGEISSKVDRLGQGIGSHDLVERLDRLTQQIEEIDYHRAHGQHSPDPAAFDRIEDRLSGIAARLDEATLAPAGDSAALQNLEAQIAHLSTLISQPGSHAGAMPEMDNRVTQLENYLATNDEYILEAARQAAEAVLENFSRQGHGPANPVDMSALAALAEDLRHLEELTRSSEERSQHTLNALHSTLVQIADRLDTMEDRFAQPLLQHPATEKWQQEPNAAPRMQFAAPEATSRAEAPREADRFHADLLNSLASSTAHAAPAASRPPVLDEDAAAADATVDESTISPEAPVAVGEPGEVEKGGLLNKITKRLRPGQKAAAATPGRTVVDPTPPLAPVDLLPAEQQNEPLEPGSGAPDVRKILERVRASQAAAAGRGPVTETDRADFIAAARRAAKAAALETDPATGGADRVSSSAKGGAGKASASALTRHRRPIMMAVGAVLLVLMTVPLVRTLTGGGEVLPPPPAPMEAPATDAAPAASEGAAEAAAVAETGPEANATSAVPPAPVEEPPAEDAAADTGTAADPTEEIASDVTAEPEATATEPVEIVAAEEAAPRIVVPASIGPKPLAEAAESGDPLALFEIGARYTDGRGVATDLSEAANWYKLAADKGFAPAQYRLANLFEKGTGVTRDVDKALTYYRQAAEAGNASAMHNLAVLHASGATGEPDYATAVDWFKKAADLGVSDSQFNLAILYARGNGAPQDLVQSYKWFAIAAKGGDQDAAQKRDEVAKAMRQDQVQAARAAADSWKAQPLRAEANEVTLPDGWTNGTPLTTGSVDVEKAILNIQAILNKSGFDAGTPDGKMGPKTTEAIKAFQTSVGQEPTGKVNDALVKELLKRNA